MRCSKCVLPETTPNIVFDKEGVCNYCHTYQKISYKGESELLKLLDSQRRTDSKYDCIVTISGGGGSTYTLLKLVKDYRMKVLAVNYESPFVEPQAKDNIENAIKALNVDIVRFTFKNNVHERTFRNNVIAWFRRPSPALIPMMCIACKTLWYDVLRIAKEYRINCIVNGVSRLEDTAFKKELLHVSKDESLELTLLKGIYGLLKETVKNPAYFNPSCIPTMVKGYLFGDDNAIGSRVFGRNIKSIYLFDYIEWDEQEALSRMKSELNWDYPCKFNSTWRFDCRVAHLKDFMYIKTLKMTERDDRYAKMVREGLITREDALLRLKEENKLYLDEIKLLLNQIGIEDISLLCEDIQGVSASLLVDS